MTVPPSPLQNGSQSTGKKDQVDQKSSKVQPSDIFTTALVAGIIGLVIADILSPSSNAEIIGFIVAFLLAYLLLTAAVVVSAASLRNANIKNRKEG